MKTEADPLDPDPPPTMRQTLGAIRHLETVVTRNAAFEGVALRYANLYGPHTSFAADGEIVAQVRKRRLPIVGDGGGVWSFVHVDDAAAATLAAVEHGDPGVYNVADDEPASALTWLPVLARGRRRQAAAPRARLARARRGRGRRLRCSRAPRAARTRRPRATSDGSLSTRAGAGGSGTASGPSSGPSRWPATESGRCHDGRSGRQHGADHLAGGAAARLARRRGGHDRADRGRPATPGARPTATPGRCSAT